jgi:hypothetical protein
MEDIRDEGRRNRPVDKRGRGCGGGAKPDRNTTVASAAPSAAPGTMLAKVSPKKILNHQKFVRQET